MNPHLQHITDGAPVSVTVNATCNGHGRDERRLVCIAEETPIAFKYNGFSYAVMMATPDDLEDFAVGFSVSEGIIAPTTVLPHVQTSASDDGVTINISLKGYDLHRYLATRRIRQLHGHTSCGLCGVEDLHDVARPPARVPAAAALDTDVILPALDALRLWQPLSRQTRGAHASAWVGVDGELLLVREDVGRHNSLDKLIGAMARGKAARAGFCLITSRCSFEMVQKAAAMGIPALVSVGAPTMHAIRLAQGAGLSLYSLSRDGEPLQFTSTTFSEKNRCPERAS
jgi:FdhD protein